MTNESRGLVITISGYHGSGRSSQAKKIAESFDLKYISSGKLFRERAEELGVSLEEMNRLATKDSEFDNWLDNRTKIESQKGSVVIDANLSAWMAEDPDLRIFFTCPLKERVRRIAERENRPYDEGIPKRIAYHILAFKFNPSVGIDRVGPVVLFIWRFCAIENRVSGYVYQLCSIFFA